MINTSIKKIQLKSLTEFPDNPQDVPPEKMAVIKHNMREKGWYAEIPLVWQNEDGNNYIISGNHRVQCAIEVGILEQDCIIIEDNSYTWERAKKDVVMFNTLHGEPDEIKLKDFINNIVDDFDCSLEDLSLDIGIDEFDLNSIIIQEDESDKKDAREKFNDYRDDLEIVDLLKSYDNIVLSYSGGKDSVALLLWFKEKNFDFKNIHVLNGTAKYFSWEDEKQYIKDQSDFLGIEIKILESDKNVHDLLVRRGYPGRMLNWCNSDLKIGPISKYYKSIQGSFIMVMGTRADESSRRAKMLDKGIWNGNSFAYPIFSMTDEEVVDLVNKYNVPMHYSYKIFDRFSCSVCYQQTKTKWSLLRKFFPNEYNKALDVFSIAMECDKWRETENCKDLCKNIINNEVIDTSNFGIDFKNWWIDK